VEAVWAEALEVEPGLRRLAWRAGGMRLIAGGLLMRRRFVNSLLFAMAAAFIAADLWQGSQANLPGGTNRFAALGLLLVLAGLAPVSWWFLGPVSGSRIARFLRTGVYIGLLALIPAWDAVEEFINQSPRGRVPLLLYRTFQPGGGDGKAWARDIIFFLIVAMYAAAIVWMTSRRSRVAPTTLFIGTAAGIVLGVVMYAIAPLGLSKAATNPWLPGSDVDPLVLLAWLLVLCGPWVAACLAYSRYTASSHSPPPRNALVRQVLAAGLLANLVGALIVVVLGTGTIALMINAPWLRNWLYHGQRLQFGVAWLQPVLRGNSAGIAYSHQIAAVSDWGLLVVVCAGFLAIAVLEVGFVTLCMWGDPQMERGDPLRGDGGGEPEPLPASDGPGRRQVEAVVDSAGSVVGLMHLREVAAHPADPELVLSGRTPRQSF
jgi:hypothetical protein